MARNYTQIMCAIWDEEDFLALSEGAQRAYFMLASQPDISAAGVLRIWMPRWAALSRTSTDESMKAALHELKTARFVVPDWVTGELLVRSFVKWDGGYKNSKRKPLIAREARAVRSVEIRQQLRIELGKLGLDTTGLPEPPPPSSPHRASDTASHGTSDADSGSAAVNGRSSSAATPAGICLAVTPPENGVMPLAGPDLTSLSLPQVDSPSDTTTDTTSPSRGVVGTSVSSPVPPQPHNPQPVPPPAAATPAPTTTTLVGEWLETCRNRPPGPVIGQTSKAIKAMLEEGIDPHAIRAGIEQWSAKGLHPAALPAVVNEVMNARPTAVRRRTSPAEDRIAGWQALKDTGTEPHLRALPGGEHL